MIVVRRIILKILQKKEKMSKPRQPVHLGGFVKPGFEKVKDVFRSNLETQTEIGGTFAAYYKQELVVNLWGGYADQKAKRLWKEDTMPCVYSTTKSASAVVIAHMVDRGLLSFKERVCQYWPEFANNGKEDVTLEMYLSNRAGLSATNEKFPMSLILTDPVKLGHILANQKPLWKPGTNHGYHPVTFALYLDQIVRHADPQRRSLSQYFHDEIAKPFDIEFYIGLPEELHYRTPRIIIWKMLDAASYIHNFKGDPDILKLTSQSPTDFKSVRTMNDPDIKKLPVGSICGHGTSAAIAKLHSILANGGVYQGKQLLSEDSINKFQQISSGGVDLAFSMDGMWSYGPMVFPIAETGKPLMYIFGHGGYGGQMGLADTRYKTGFCYATNYLDASSRSGADDDRRWISMYETLYECIYKLENVPSSQERRTFYEFGAFKKFKGSRL
ncbi:beta-lactamase domain-containing protein 2-like [Mytilus trossulus]|uniref:beta-lactamase domain-containing protein 2-like n=1 Tax=Mytilus trossulus TaxID=6551 RepID=UPI00300460B0